MMKISFDWDGCLGDESFVKVLFDYFYRQGNDCWIVTARSSQHDNKDIKEFVKNYRIPISVYYTDGSPKQFVLSRLDIDLHFDNDLEEVEYCNRAGINALCVNPFMGDNVFINFQYTPE